MEDNILNVLLAKTYIHSHLLHRISVLKSYLSKKLFSDDSDFEELSKADKTFLELLDENFYKQFTRENLSSIFEALEEKIKKIQPLVIYLSFELPDTESLKLGNFLRKNFTAINTFDPRVDPTLIAGCALIYNGLYKDYSLKSRLEQNRDKILVTFKRYFSH